ncbi:Amino acid permease [Gammaproteobacteria bacterium]
MVKRSVSVVSLLFASISAIIGSGWLFSSYYAAICAGSASVLSWILGGLAILIIAFVFGEICSLLPITGFSARVPQYTHGTVVGFIFSWIIWLSYAAMTPTETQAIIQYVSYYFPQLVHGDNALTKYGYITATFLMLLVSVINVYSLRWLIRSNNFLTVFKMVIPLFIAFVLLSGNFSIENTFHPVDLPFAPFGLKGVFAALSSGGIVFAFNGFKQAAEMAGETKKPHLALPIALAGSIVICLVIYLFLQVAFINSLQPDNLKYGWNNLMLAASSSPLASVIAESHAEWLLPFLYSCAIIAPLAAAMMYCSSAGRSLYGMSKNRYVPFILQKLNPHGNPGYAITANFFVGMLMFAPLPGWNNMVAFLSSLMAITYAIGPISLLSLRKQAPDHPRLFRLPVAYIWSATAFYLCTLLIYWCGWHIVYMLDITILVGLTVILVYQYISYLHKKPVELHWRASIWLLVYFSGLSLISYLGSFGGGLSIISFGIDFIMLGIFSIFVIYLSLEFMLSPEKTRAYIKELQAEI